MLIKMFKALYPNTKITGLNNSVDDKIILHACNNSCMPQMELCKVNIMNKSLSSSAVSL